MTKKEEKPKKEIKQISPKEFRDNLDLIVDQLVIQASSRDVVNEIIKTLKSEYGLNATNVRKAANIIFKSNLEEENEKNEEVNALLELYSKRNNSSE